MSLTRGLIMMFDDEKKDDEKTDQEKIEEGKKVGGGEGEGTPEGGDE